ncbi:right-handed parallel beta-helix repeat-containing protein [Enterococcus sp. LJL120]
MTIFHVSKNGKDVFSGTEKEPFLTIQKAAERAAAGDTVIIHAGEYREWVKPQNPGISNVRRIIYQSAPNEKVVIKGSEKVDQWDNIEGPIWKSMVNNDLFNGFNPFEKLVWGDWLISVKDRTTHLGEVYLNGLAMYEAKSFEEVKEPVTREKLNEFFTGVESVERYSERMNFTWFAEVLEDATIIYANFQDVNPNEELVEINVRPACFYPERDGIDYITVKGLELCQAATSWAPPTGNQPGLIGPRWSKGWIIEDCEIHDAKCSGISLGKVAESGDNYYSKRLDKPGYTYQLESVFTAERQGWNKESVGSHTIRRNHIHDCGQNGIVGHLGCVFSKIYDNRIHDISLKREFYGWEISGIKLHAALDVEIRHNLIYNCAGGTWLDWQTQGTRVHQNTYFDNGLDLFVEVSHGPYLIDNNILASRNSLRNMSQGGAYVNNLFAGEIEQHDVRDRATPYHLKHSTKVKGYAVVYGGDDRFYNNIFIGLDEKIFSGTSNYDGHHISLKEYIDEIQSKAPTDLEGFLTAKDPVYINNNVYLKQASSFNVEKNKLDLPDFDPSLEVSKDGEKVFLEIDLPEEIETHSIEVQTTRTLPHVRIVDAEFENPDGSELIVEKDLLNEKVAATAGPIQRLKAGNNRIQLW